MRPAVPRVALAVLFAATLVVGLVLPAAAEGPIYRGPLPFGSVTVAGVCSFPFQITYSTGNVKIAYWETSEGGQVWLWTGVARDQTYTNLDTGYSVTLNEPGMLKDTIYPDGSEYILFAGTHGPPMSSPNWVLTGAQKVYITPEGAVTWTFSGRAEEVCAMLDH